MKTYTMVLAAMILFGIGTTDSQTPFADDSSYKSASYKCAEKNFEACLKTDNDGVLESSLGLIGRIKLAKPECKLANLEKEIARLMTDGPTPRIRYKAYLIHNLFTSPELFAVETAKGYKDSDELFSALAGRLQQANLSANEGR